MSAPGPGFRFGPSPAEVDDYLDDLARGAKKMRNTRSLDSFEKRVRDLDIHGGKK